ncbi:MAG: hypothetical protein QXO32_04920 [Candidatus Bathyarchaeia archaeon]
MNQKGRRRNPYGTIKLTENLLKTIDAYIDSDSGRLLGFANRADFVSSVIKNYLERNVESIEVPLELVKWVDSIKSVRGRKNLDRPK